MDIAMLICLQVAARHAIPICSFALCSVRRWPVSNGTSTNWYAPSAELANNSNNYHIKALMASETQTNQTVQTRNTVHNSIGLGLVSCLHCIVMIAFRCVCIAPRSIRRISHWHKHRHGQADRAQAIVSFCCCLSSSSSPLSVCLCLQCHKLLCDQCATRIGVRVQKN